MCKRSERPNAISGGDSLKTGDIVDGLTMADEKDERENHLEQAGPYVNIFSGCTATDRQRSFTWQ